MAKTYNNKVQLMTTSATPDGKTVRVTLPDDMYLDFSKGVGFKTQIVQELPETGDPRVIYLVPAEDEQEQNIYNEYMFIEGAWECIGSTATGGGHLMVGTEAQRLAYTNTYEGLEWNETHTAEESPVGKAYVRRWLFENGAWVEIESPATEPTTLVMLHVNTYDGARSTQGLTVGVTDEKTHQVKNYLLDDKGECAFEIIKGHDFTISVQSISGYQNIPDSTFKAEGDEKSIILTFYAESTTYETVLVHATVYNMKLQDITNTDTGLIGLEIKCEIEDGDTLIGNLDASHQCTFQVPYGKKYTIKEPTVSDYMPRYGQTFTHTASIPQRTAPMHYVQWVASGVYGVDENQAMYTYSDMQKMSQEERSKIIAIALSTSRLTSAGAGFMYKVPRVVASPNPQWAASNVEFDQTLLPFKQNHAAAVLDMNGALNTENIIDLGDTMGVNTPAADYCAAQTLEIGGQTKRGFLGSYGQMYALSENITELNAMHTLLGIAAPGFTSGYWWTSTQYNATSAVLLTNGSLYTGIKLGTNTTMALFAL